MIVLLGVADASCGERARVIWSAVSPQVCISVRTCAGVRPGKIHRAKRFVVISKATYSCGCSSSMSNVTNSPHGGMVLGRSIFMPIGFPKSAGKPAGRNTIKLSAATTAPLASTSETHNTTRLENLSRMTLPFSTGESVPFSRFIFEVRKVREFHRAAQGCDWPVRAHLHFPTCDSILRTDGLAQSNQAHHLRSRHGAGCMDWRLRGETRAA